MAEPYEGYSYCSYPGSVSFEVDFVEATVPQDTPVEGKQPSVMVSSIPSGSKYKVNGIAWDFKGNEWWRVDVGGSLVWVSSSGNSMKITDATKGSYDTMATTYDYTRCKNIAGSLEYQKKVAFDYSQEIVPVDVPVTESKNGYSLVTRSSSPKMSCWPLDAYLGRMKNVFGLPPQWNPYTDPIVGYGELAIGRRYSQLIMSNPTIIALSPGVIKYANNLVDTLTSSADWGNTDSLKETFTNGNVDMLWKFEQRWGVENDSYLNYVNALCKYAIECMSSTENGYLVETAGSDDESTKPLNRRRLPSVFGVGSAGGEAGTYSDFDISWLLGSNVVNVGSTLMTETNNGFWKTFVNLGVNYFLGNVDGTLTNGLKDFQATMLNAIDNLNQPHFVYFSVDGQVSTREQFSTETRSSIIETFISGAMNDTIRDIAFITTGAMVDAADSDIEQIKNLAFAEFGSGLGNILASAMDMIKGGNMMFPQMIGDVSWGREYTFTTKFISVYGDVESRFLNVIMPYICLMCLCLPRQMHTPMDMYAYPFIVQAYAKGLFACPAGVLTGIEVTRGGGEETGWTGGGQPTEIDVSFSIKPLHVKLMMSGDSLWFLKNVGMQNYMGTICGVDLTMKQTELINQTAKMFFSDTFSLDNIATRIMSSAAAWVQNNQFAKTLRFFADMAGADINNG